MRRVGTRTRKMPGSTAPASTYTAIVQRQWAFVRNMARRCGVPEHHRDDIAVEVFLRFQKHADTLTSPDLVRGWLRTTTVHVAHEHFDARASRYETPTATERIKREGQAAGAEEGLLEKETFLALLRHIEALEPARRAVFLAYAVDGLTTAQIARRFGIPENTVHNRLRLARRQLQAALRRERVVEQRKRGARGLALLPLLLLLQPDLLRRVRDLAHERGGPAPWSAVSSTVLALLLHVRAAVSSAILALPEHVRAGMWLAALAGTVVLSAWGVIAYLGARLGQSTPGRTSRPPAGPDEKMIM